MDLGIAQGSGYAPILSTLCAFALPYLEDCSMMGVSWFLTLLLLGIKWGGLVWPQTAEKSAQIYSNAETKLHSFLLPNLKPPVIPLCLSQSLPPCPPSNKYKRPPFLSPSAAL